MNLIASFSNKDFYSTVGFERWKLLAAYCMLLSYPERKYCYAQPAGSDQLTLPLALPPLQLPFYVVLLTHALIHACIPIRTYTLLTVILTLTL